MKRGILVAIAFVMAVNGVVLAGVRYNRSGSDSAVEMTERELRLRSSFREDSGVSLHLELNREWGKPLAWFDRKKLAELGFEVSGTAEGGKEAVGLRKILPRRVYAVLEYDGEAWQQWRERKRRELEKAGEKLATAEGEARKPAERERKDLERQIAMGSRLFPVDAGLDPAALRTRYPDRRRYVITPAVAGLSHWPADRAERTKAEVYGYIAAILTDEIAVPRHLQGVLAGVTGQRRLTASEALAPDAREGQEMAPRYAVTLRYGKRYEPWVESVRRMGEGK